MHGVTFYSTWPDLASAEAAARRLLEQRLIACANIVPGAISVFRWRGEVRAEPETVMFAKTTSQHAAAARDALLAEHPYELPCVVALELDVEKSSSAFLAWIGSETGAAT